LQKPLRGKETPLRSGCTQAKRPQTLHSQGFAANVMREINGSSGKESVD